MRLRELLLMLPALLIFGSLPSNAVGQQATVEVLSDRCFGMAVLARAPSTDWPSNRKRHVRKLGKRRPRDYTVPNRTN